MDDRRARKARKRKRRRNRMEINWTIPMCEHVIADGGINVAHWRCTATETVGEGDDAVTYSATSYGSLGLTYDASSPDFTAYDEVTEEQVESWVWASGVDKDATEAALQANIENQKNPTEASGTPWN